MQICGDVGNENMKMAGKDGFNPGSADSYISFDMEEPF